MEWYTKYLSIFGLTLSEIPGDTLSEIGTLLHEKQSDPPFGIRSSDCAQRKSPTY